MCLNVFQISDATVYVGGLDEKVSEPLLWELFLQAGPVVNTHMPKDRVTGQHQGLYQFAHYYFFQCTLKVLKNVNILMERDLNEILRGPEKADEN